MPDAPGGFRFYTSCSFYPTMVVGLLSERITEMNANSSSRFTILKAIFLPLAAAALLLSACNSCPEPEQQLPDGVYTTTITVEDWANNGLPAEKACENVGTFNLTLTGSKWSIFQTAAPGCEVYNPSQSGSVKFCGNEARFTDDIQNGCTHFIYKWAFDGSELRFTKIDDNCAYRLVVMTTYPWVLQK
jgi:hypothetical protein